MEEEEVKDRRPIASRNSSWAEGAARCLQQRGATPNGISVASIVFAGLAGGCFGTGFCFSQPISGVLLIAGALCVQGRLICNLLDGMVAVEGGMKTPTGAVFNDLPDRVSDTLILAGIGYGLTGFPWAVPLGWATALFAALTAYIRVLGGACGLAQRFTGPMAKPHRMALVTAGAIIAAFLPACWGQWLMLGVLVVIAAGCVVTCVVRTRNICRELGRS